MIPREVLKQVRRIEISTRGLVNDVFSGEYHSVFKGRGMNFAEVREYQYGDDIRSIDWNVTARCGSPFVKVFIWGAEYPITGCYVNRRLALRRSWTLPLKVK